MEKIKLFIQSEKGKDIFIILIVILVGLGSFELGRLSKASNSSSGIKIDYPQGLNTASASAISGLDQANSTKSALSAKPSGKAFFASNRGSKYYSVGCSAGKTIKEENRVYFGTSTEAVAAGYELSTSCK